MFTKTTIKLYLRRFNAMKRSLLAAVVTGLLLFPALSFAGVAGGSHDLRTWAGPGGAQDLCFACHIPHNAFGTNLWARDLTGLPFSGVQQMCYSCHNGTVTPIGGTNIFNTDPAIENHLTVGTDCSGDNACHDVHDQNPTPGGRFVVVTETNGSYCETCHDATMFPGAEGWGDHTAGITHYTNGVDFTCNQCHSIHGALALTTPIPGLTNPIILAEQITGGQGYGAFCIDCHEDGTVPPSPMPGTGGEISGDLATYFESDESGNELRHPTFTSDGTFDMSGCDVCHDVHDPAGTADPYILQATNDFSDWCQTCHDGVDGPTVGGSSHPVDQAPSDAGMNPPTLPWSDEIDDDNDIGNLPDYPGAIPSQIVCESCHSAHRLGVAGYFIRVANTSANEICSACHSDN
jgi:hypothetical protein